MFWSIKHIIKQLSIRNYNPLTQINHWPIENKVVFRIRIILITRYYYLLPKRSIYILRFARVTFFFKRIENDTTSPHITQRTDNAVSTKRFAIFYDWFFFTYAVLTMTYRVLDPERKNYTQNAFTVGRFTRVYSHHIYAHKFSTKIIDSYWRIVLYVRGVWTTVYLYVEKMWRIL